MFTPISYIPYIQKALYRAFSALFQGLYFQGESRQKNNRPFSRAVLCGLYFVLVIVDFPIRGIIFSGVYDCIEITVRLVNISSEHPLGVIHVRGYCNKPSLIEQPPRRPLLYSRVV